MVYVCQAYALVDPQLLLSNLGQAYCPPAAMDDIRTVFAVICLVFATLLSFQRFGEES
jgi:hypothetical protein